MTRSRKERDQRCCPTHTAPTRSRCSARRSAHNLERTIARVPDAEALVSCHQGVRYTYAEFGEAVDRLAGGDARGRPAHAATGSACGARTAPSGRSSSTRPPRPGVILVNINPAYRVERAAVRARAVGLPLDLRRPRSSRARTSSRWSTQVRAELPGARARGVLRDRRVGGAGLGRRLHRRPACARRASSTSTTRSTSSTRAARPASPRARRSPTTTSSTTATSSARCSATPKRDRVCIPVPLYHCFGMVLGNLAATIHGACMVYPAETFDPVATLEACAEERCTSLYGVPTMFIAAARPRALLRVRLRLAADRDHGRVAVPDRGDEARRAPRWGSTEMSDRVRDDRDLAGDHPGPARRHAREPLRHRRPGACRTSRSRSSIPTPGAPSPRGEPGEFLARGYVVMRGYWNDPERTAEAIDAQRWMHTGDLATMDEQGYVRIVGRIKDMVIRGGENVYPREIEEFLYTHPADRRRPGDRRARRALRRGADGLGHPAPRRLGDRGRDPRVLPGHRSPTTRSRAT